MKRKKAIAAAMVAIALVIILGVTTITSTIISVLSVVYDEESKKAIQLDGIPPFITSEMLIAALSTQEKFGYPASVCIAQVIAESGFGRYGPGGEEGKGLSKLAYNYKNLFGIKGKSGTAGGVNMSTGEQTSSGDSYNISAYFRAYYTYTECIEDRAKVLTQVYSDLIGGVTDAKEFARKMGGRWATDIQYAQKLIGHMDTYDLYRLDSMTVSDMNGGGTGSGEMPRFYQNDYAHIAYGSSNLAVCGCGPTCFSMVASYLGRKKITPEDAVRWCGNAYYVSGAGTSWGYFTAAARHFNLPANVQQCSPSFTTTTMVFDALKKGQPVICSQRSGLFTSGGHFIVLSGITSNGKIMVHDPNKNNALNKGYNTRQFDFNSEINVTALQYFIFK